MFGVLESQTNARRETLFTLFVFAIHLLFDEVLRQFDKAYMYSGRILKRILYVHITGLVK